MKEYLKNSIVTLIEKEDHFIITHDTLTVGRIDVKDETVSVFIEPSYRGNHYASNALYLVTKYMHDVNKVASLKASVSLGNDIWKHVVEHSGYHIAEKHDDHIIYVHNKAHTTLDDDLVLSDGLQAIYLAGGCFWGMERVFQMLDGVVSTTVGYVNGNKVSPSYEDIIRNETGYKECVRVIFDTHRLDVQTILQAYFLCIDPTVTDRQKDDIGTQYQTGIYYKNCSLIERIEEVYNREKSRYEVFCMELAPVKCFYEAEEYHQNYLVKNPEGYCHITPVDLEKVRKLNQKK